MSRLHRDGQLLFPFTWPAAVWTAVQTASSASDINIWSQNSSCPSKFSQGEEKVAQSRASCWVYYFSIWPLTYRHGKDFGLSLEQTSIMVTVRRRKTREIKVRQTEVKVWLSWVFDKSGSKRHLLECEVWGCNLAYMSVDMFCKNKYSCLSLKKRWWWWWFKFFAKASSHVKNGDLGVTGVWGSLE